MSTPAPRTLFLDAGGVLVHPDWDFVAGVLVRHGLDVDGDALRCSEPLAKFDMDVPESVRETDDDARGPLLFEGVIRHAGLDPADPRLAACWREIRARHDERNLWDVVPPGVPAFLDACRERGLRLVVVSNAGANLSPLLARVGLSPRFDHIVISAVVGIEKPDPRIFLHALEVSGADPATTVHVGDFWEIDVVGARAAGLRAIIVDPAGLYADRDAESIPRLAALGNLDNEEATWPIPSTT